MYVKNFVLKIETQLRIVSVSLFAKRSVSRFHIPRFRLFKTLTSTASLVTGFLSLSSKSFESTVIVELYRHIKSTVTWEWTTSWKLVKLILVFAFATWCVKLIYWSLLEGIPPQSVTFSGNWVFHFGLILQKQSTKTFTRQLLRPGFYGPKN